MARWAEVVLSIAVKGNIYFVESRFCDFRLPQVELEEKLQEFQYGEQQLQLAKSSLQRHLEQVTEEKEEREKEAVSWFNALEVESHPFHPVIACVHPE